MMAGPVCTPYRVLDRTLIIDLGGRRKILSSAPQGGGLCVASHILNHQVADNPAVPTDFPRRLGDPARCLKNVAAKYGLKAATVGLMTAVPMTQLVTARCAAASLWVECFATVGVSNAVRAGEWENMQIARDFGRDPVKPGTINLIVVTNVSLPNAALVGAVQVATEAKTGVLVEAGVLSCESGSFATGTGTDAVVIACRLRGEGRFCRYSGTHTVLGALIGQAVTRCVSVGLDKAKHWFEKDLR
ncbi:MAG: adenosylcobinamide amidohydrolase [Nitrospira sp.]|nr:adenosylcobinamide amidohydrolase [Nitrospira sp.]